jgi:hypothetical protein
MTKEEARWGERGCELCVCGLRNSINRCLSPRETGCAFSSGRVVPSRRWEVLRKGLANGGSGNFGLELE